MNIDYDAVMNRANVLYAQAKTAHIPQQDLAYWAPEMFPKIQSEQVKCLLRALVEEINSGDKCD